MKLNGEEIPSVVEIGVEGVCYSLTLWWEVRLIMRLLPTEKRGKNSGAEGEVEGDVSAPAGKCVLEEVDNARIETHLQSADGTRGQTGGSGLHLAQSWGLVGSLVGAQEGLQLIGEPIKLGLSEALRSSDLGSGPVGLDPVLSPAPKAGSSSTGPSSLEGSRRVKALEAFGAPGPARMDNCRGPSQSLVGSFGVALPLVWAGPSPLRGPDAKSFPLWVKDGRRKQIEEELYSVERSRTDIALIEEASRYGCAPNPCGLLASGFSSSPSFFFGRTPLGEYCDLSGDDRETSQRETPLRMLLTLGPIEEENVSRWELTEANNGCNENCGKELCLVQSMPREGKRWEEDSLEESDLAKFSEFLGFSTKGLEKEILDFLVKIRKRRERVHNKNLLEKSKFERELKRLECSINYEGGKNRNVECK